MGSNQLEMVGTPREALTLMSSRWPAQTNGSYHEAKRTCAAFLKRKASRDRARDAFVSAAVEAGLLH
jgi:hypothetical protein